MGIALASSAPDALQNLLPAPAALPEWPGLRKAAAGLGAMSLLYVACALVGRRLTRQRSA
jgi:hypothetical protein